MVVSKRYFGSGTVTSQDALGLRGVLMLRVGSFRSEVGGNGNNCKKRFFINHSATISESIDKLTV
jgi:hypothetical protein